MKRASVFWLFLVLTGCQNAPIQMEKANGVFQGENLLQRLPFPELRWQGRSENKGDAHVAEWQSQTGERFDVIIFLGDKKMSLDENREIDVSTGQKICKRFTTEIVDAPSQTEYPSTVWIGRCEQADGSVKVVLQKAIRGKDSFYNLKMIWKSEPGAASLDIWKKYLLDVSVCDTRSSATPCPATMSSGMQQ